MGFFADVGPLQVFVSHQVKLLAILSTPIAYYVFSLYIQT
jgi:hypothetical protein